LFGNADRIIVNLFLGPASAGLYAAATAVTMKINKLSAIPLKVLSPWVSEAQALSQTSRIQQIFLQATRLNGVIVFFITSLIIFWAYPLAVLLVGEPHAGQTAGLLRMLALAYGLYSLNAPGFFTAIGLGYPIINAKWAFAGGLLTCVLLFLLLPTFTLFGAGLANFGYIITLVVNHEVVRIIKINYSVFISFILPTIGAILLWWLIIMIFHNYIFISLFWISLFILIEIISLIIVFGIKSSKEITLFALNKVKR
jgi:O-antigen/teichoic acid export membrane protein